MQTMFTRHWGGWVASTFRKDFCAKEATIVQVDNQSVGYFSLQATEKELYISNIQLTPSMQGKGLGSAILKDTLKANSHKHIRLTTFTDNPAMQLYKRLGFRVEKQEEETVYMVKLRG